jgi:hypothetical protein
VKLVGLVRKRPPTDPGRIKAVKDVLFVASLAFRYMFLWRGGGCRLVSPVVSSGVAAVTLINSKLKKKLLASQGTPMPKV